MHRYIVGVASAIFGLVGGTLAQPAAMSPSQADGAERKVVLDHELKEAIDGKHARVAMVEVTYPPGTGTPKHQHAGSVFVYVIEGAIESQVEGQPLQTYKQGEAFSNQPERCTSFRGTLARTNRRSSSPCSSQRKGHSNSPLS